jgi:hypothetical protein
MSADGVFPKPTSVLIFGNDRPLLNWVAYALATINDPEFVWTDVRSPDQVPSATDPMSRHKIPPERMYARRPMELTLNDSAANVAVSAVVRSDETPENVQRLLDFLRLPSPTQHVLSTPRRNRPLVAVLSNSQRLAALYPSVENVSFTLRSILATDATVIMTFADTPTEGKRAFDAVVLVDGSLREGWRTATLTVEKGPSEGGLPTGLAVRLGEFAPVASILSREIDGPAEPHREAP